MFENVLLLRESEGSALELDITFKWGSDIRLRLLAGEFMGFESGIIQVYVGYNSGILNVQSIVI